LVKKSQQHALKIDWSIMSNVFGVGGLHVNRPKETIQLDSFSSELSDVAFTRGIHGGVRKIYQSDFSLI
jgi:hypothetical protein